MVSGLTFASSKGLLIEGTEHVDLAGVAKRGVRLGYTPDVLNDAGRWTTACSVNSAGGIGKSGPS